MLELMLLRHAKSSWADPGQADHDRPLNPRGRSAADLMGRCCAREGLLPDLVRSSDAARTRETVSRWSAAARWDGPVEWMPSLYHAPPHRLLDAARTAPPDVRCLMVVAHNPGMEELAGALAGREIIFPTGTLSIFRAEIDDWADLDLGAWREVLTWRPKEIADQDPGSPAGADGDP